MADPNKKKYQEMSEIEKLERDIAARKKAAANFEMQHFGKPGYTAQVKVNAQQIADMKKQQDALIKAAETAAQAERDAQNAGRTTKRGN